MGQRKIHFEIKKKKKKRKLTESHVHQFAIYTFKAHQSLKGYFLLPLCWAFNLDTSPAGAISHSLLDKRAAGAISRLLQDKSFSGDISHLLWDKSFSGDISRLLWDKSPAGATSRSLLGCSKLI